jgi:hypothetical protein
VKLPSTVAIAVISFAIAAIVVVGGLIWHGDDPGPLITFMGTLVPLTIGVVVVAYKVDKVQDTADDVAHNVNGKLNAQFAALHERLDTLVPEQATGKHEATPAGVSPEDLTPSA